MKKLMIAAAAAAMVGGAFADLCDDTINSDCGAWKVNFTLKTLVPKRTVCKSGGCADCSDSSKECVFYYEQGTRKIQGYIWGCDSNCFDDGSDYFYTLWEPAFKFAWAPIERTSVTNAAGQVIGYQYDANGFEGAFLRYSKKATKVAWMWATDALSAERSVKEGRLFVEDEKFYEAWAYGNGGAFEFMAAGLSGSYDKKNHYLKSASGNVIGMISGMLYCGIYGDENLDCIAKTMDFCQDFTSWCEDGDETPIVPAVGTVKIAYDKALSNGNKSIFSVIPDYAKIDVVAP